MNFILKGVCTIYNDTHTTFVLLIMWSYRRFLDRKVLILTNFSFFVSAAEMREKMEKLIDISCILGQTRLLRTERNRTEYNG